MRKSSFSNGGTALGRLLPVFIAFSWGGVMAQPAPPDVVASPEIYKTVAQNQQYRIVEGTWEPGQRDRFHSHPAMLFYWVTDCQMRWHMPDGTTRDTSVTAGYANSQPPIESHVVENRGPSNCRVIMFEAYPAP